MAQTEPQSKSKLWIILLLALLLLVIGGFLRWYLQPPPPPPTLPPIVQAEPPRPEPIPEREPVVDAAAPEATPEPPPRVRARTIRRRRVRRRRRRRRRRPRRRFRRKPKPRKERIPEKRAEPIPEKKPEKRPEKKPEKRPEKKPEVRKPVPTAPGKLILWHDKRITGPFRMLRVQYTLNGKVIYLNKKPESLSKKFRFYERAMPVGKYALFAYVYLRGIGFGAFSSLNEMRIQVRSALPFVIKSNEALTVEVRLSENKQVALKKRLSIKFNQSRKALPKKAPTPKR